MNRRPACQTRPGIEPGISPKREPRRDENSNRLTGRRRIMKIFRIQRQQKKCRPIQSDTMYRPAAHIQDDELYLPAGQLGMGWWGDAWDDRGQIRGQEGPGEPRGGLASSCAPVSVSPLRLALTTVDPWSCLAMLAASEMLVYRPISDPCQSTA